MNRAIAAHGMNRPFESIAAFEGLITNSVWAAELTSAWAQLSIPLYMIGEHERALEAARRSYELDPTGGFFGPVFVLRFQLRPLAALGRLEELNELLNEMDAQDDPPEMGLALVVSLDVLDAHGHNDAKQVVEERALSWFSARPQEEKSSLWYRMYFSGALIHAGQLDHAQRLQDDLTADAPRRKDFRGVRALVSTLRGDTAQALADAEWFDRLEGPEARDYGWFWGRAVIAAAFGDLESAMAYFREGNVRLDRNDWSSIWFAPLRGYPPFEELVAPKG
jgi:tetratricopeptide (TPR) repeat protein